MEKKLTPAQQIEHTLTKQFRRELWSKFQIAVGKYELIQPGDKVMVCISGGKDSMCMAKLIQLYQRYHLVDFEVKFVVMDPGYNEINRAKIESNLQLLGIPAEIFETNIFAVANNSDKSPCYLCARMRRGYLYNHAREIGCNKIALGHHLNDVIETTVMSMFYSSKLETIIPKSHSENFPGLELIRPMYCIKEADIIAWARANDLQFIQCACRFTENCTICDNGGGGSTRQEVKNLIRRLSKTNPMIEDNIFRALHAVQIESFPGYKANGEMHSFLEDYDDKGHVYTAAHHDTDQ